MQMRSGPPMLGVAVEVNVKNRSAMQQQTLPPSALPISVRLLSYGTGIQENPYYHAIVWQCRRTSDYCDSLKAKGLTRYFPPENRPCDRCLFFRHQVKMDPGSCRRRQRTGPERGTSLWNGGNMADLEADQRARIHVTDYSNASRTMLFNINYSAVG